MNKIIGKVLTINREPYLTEISNSEHEHTWNKGINNKVKRNSDVELIEESGNTLAFIVETTLIKKIIIIRRCNDYPTVFGVWNIYYQKIFPIMRHL